MAEMLTRGTGKLGEEAFSDALDQIGARLNAGAGLDRMTWSLEVPLTNALPALKLWNAAWTAPTFDQSTWTVAKETSIADIEQAMTQPGTIARLVAAKAFLPAGDLYARPTEGTPKSLKAISTAD
jgi:predicted Zn-dependent peptidase